MFGLLATLGALGLLADPKVPAPGAADPVIVQRIAVPDLKAKLGVTPELTSALSSALVTEVRERSGAKVMGSEEMRSMFDFVKQKQQLGCQDVACLAEIGGALGAAQIVSGSLSRFGDTYLLTLQLVDVRHGTVVRDASGKQTSTHEDSLLALVHDVVLDLFPEGTTTTSGLRTGTNAKTYSGVAPHQHTTGAVLLCVGGVLLAAAAIGVVGVVEFGNLKTQSFQRSIPISQGHKSQDGATLGFAVAWTAGPVGAVLTLAGAVTF